MAVQTDQARVWHWAIGDPSATPRNAIELAQELAAHSAIQSCQVTLNNSPAGIQIVGEIAEMAPEFESHQDAEFFNVGINGQMQPNGKYSIGIALGHRRLNVNVQPPGAANAETIREIVERHFPPADGPSEAQIDAKMARIQQLFRQAGEASEAAETARHAAEAAAEAGEQAISHSRSIESVLQESNTRLTAVQESEAQASESAARVRTALDETNAARDSAKQASDETGPLLEAIRSSSEEVDRHDERLGQLYSTSETRLKKAEDDSKSIVDRHQDLQTQIEEALQKAVGAGLFGAFRDRKDEVVKAKWRWVGLACVAAAAQIAVIAWLVQYVTSPDTSFQMPIFLLRAAASLPIVAVFVFAIRQFGRERDFEEIYAFKSALSFSLKPYLDLVEQLEEVDSGKHQEFVTQTIKQVFDFPADHPRGPRSTRRRARKAVSEDVLREVAKVIDFARKAGS